MSAVLKYIIDKTYRPLLVRYLSTTRTWTYRGITLEIPPEVFHPRFFSSTRLLLKAVSRLPLENRSFLEPGAGNALISFYAARQQARVTASDISRTAIRTIRKNQQVNGIFFETILSDLFDNIPPAVFDVIAINPPYYRKDPADEREYAWYCGKDGQYFQKLFSGLGSYMHPASEVLMVLCDGCDLDMINRLADNYGFELKLVSKHQSLIERNFIYRVETKTDEQV